MKFKTLKLFLIFSAAVLIGLGTFSGCGKKSTGLSGSIEVAGSSTVYPVTVAVAEDFNKIHPGVKIPVRSTGTGGGFKNFFIPGKTDINDASRRIKEKEIKSCQEKGFEALEFQVAIDAITVVVNKDSKVNEMTTADLKKIWQPEKPAQVWSDVNPAWGKAKFELYGPTSASGTFDYFTKKIVGEEGASRSDYQKTEQDNTIVQAVSGSKNALGYFGMAYYLENKDKVKALKVNGVMPSLENARSGKYKPLSRPIFIYVNSASLKKKKELQEFVRFYLKKTSTKLVSDVGYVPVTEEIMKANLAKLEAAIK
jgi:phosphate transport system substrate-binding protein